MSTFRIPLGLTCFVCAILFSADEPGFEFRKHENWGMNSTDWSVDVPGWVPLKPDEHPRLVFRKADLAALKLRAESPEGKTILARLQKLLEGKRTLSHPAGYGLLYQLTGDAKNAEKAKELMAEILDKKLADEKDGRYAFYRGGRDPEMRVGPAIWIMGLAYDLNYDAWDETFRQRVAIAIQDNPLTAKIAAKGPLGPSVNHFGAAVGGVGAGLLAIRGDTGIDAKKVNDMLANVVMQVRDDIAIGRGDRGYFFEGHQCGRISSNTGMMPFLQAYRIAAGKDLVSHKDNARWIAAQWIYEFAVNPDGTHTDAQRGMYCRDFPRGGMWSENGDFALGFGLCPPDLLPALKWVYDYQVEPGEKTYDVLDYPAQAIYALVNWPIGVTARNPGEILPRVQNDTGAGYYVFRNGWSPNGGDIVVSALLGTHLNGRGMATGGSIYVTGKGLGWAGQAAKYRFPGIFYTSYPVYSKFEKDGSAVISAVSYAEKLNKFNLNVQECSTKPTSLAVDYSGACGAELLVAMAGPMVGSQVEYWMDIKPAKVTDVTGGNGYATKTTEVKLGGGRAFVMTLQKGKAPDIKQDGDAVVVGGRRLTFDGIKLVLSAANAP